MFFFWAGVLFCFAVAQIFKELKILKIAFIFQIFFIDLVFIQILSAYQSIARVELRDIGQSQLFKQPIYNFKNKMLF